MIDRISQTCIYKIQNLPSIQLSDQGAHLTNFISGSHPKQGFQYSCSLFF